MTQAFQYVLNNGGICAESDYAYTARDGVCKSSSCKSAMTISSFLAVPKENEDALMAGIAKRGPIAVAIQADQRAFQFYKSGVFTAPCGTSLDHGVLAVGYGSDNGQDYYVVKNSWGPSWGEEGYIRIQRGEDLCGIAMQASYPTGAKVAPTPAPAPPSAAPPSASPPSMPAPAPAPATSSPPPSPAPAAKSHYGDPAKGCLPSELAVEVQGAAGDFCSSKCVPLFHPCPKDKPAGVSAMPMCALTDQAHGVSYCALICANIGQPIDDAANAMCGPRMSCQSLQGGVGICTYPM